MKISGVHVSRIREFMQIVTYKSQIKEQSWDSLNRGFIWRAGNLSWQQINIKELCFVTHLTWQILEREVGGGKDCQSSCQDWSSVPSPARWSTWLWDSWCLSVLLQLSPQALPSFFEFSHCLGVNLVFFHGHLGQEGLTQNKPLTLSMCWAGNIAQRSWFFSYSGVYIDIYNTE